MLIKFSNIIPPHEVLPMQYETHSHIKFPVFCNVVPMKYKYIEIKSANTCKFCMFVKLFSKMLLEKFICL